MRVLDTHTGQFEDINPKRNIAYAILSHTWDPEGEQTYQKLRKIQKRYAPSDDSSSDEDNSSRRQLRARALPPPTSDEPLLSPIWNYRELSPKIREACRVARENGYRYIWIDSCCIDKTSSSELSESINSMYQWYARADVCYAFLPDVPTEEDHQRRGSHFRKSRWFRRGWTLQELIAPLDVRFLSVEWTFVGSKESLADIIVEITKIHHNALLNIEPLEEFSVAQRLSWAARRETTRAEDRAYSLLGIFDINMPTLYGEGQRAFRRLQEEIMRRTPDQSLFAWTDLGSPLDLVCLLNDANIKDIQVRLWRRSVSFLPPFCHFYKRCSSIEALSHDEVARRLQLQPMDLPARRYEFTPYGISVQLPVISFLDFFPSGYVSPYSDIPLSQWYLVILGCGHENFNGHLFARICYTQSQGSSVELLYSGMIVRPSRCELLALSPAAITRFRASGGQISIKTLYTPQPERVQGVRYIVHWKRHETIKLVLQKKMREALSAQGYTATLRSPDHAHPRTHLVTLSHDTHTIFIDCQHTLEERDDDGQRLTIEVHVKTSGPFLQDIPGDPRFLRANDLVTGMLWEDQIRWRNELPVQDVLLTDIAGGPAALTVRLGLTFARTNHYFLRIELKTADPGLAHAPVAGIEDGLDGRPGSSYGPVRAVGRVENVGIGTIAARDRIPGPGPGGGHRRWTL